MSRNAYSLRSIDVLLSLLILEATVFCVESEAKGLKAGMTKMQDTLFPLLAYITNQIYG